MSGLIFMVYPNTKNYILFEGDFMNLFATHIYNILYTKMSSLHYIYILDYDFIIYLTIYEES